MTAPVVVMVEEPSIRIVLEELCARLGYSDVVIVLQHDGKSDLEKSIAVKVNGWRGPVPAHFVISRDLDASDRADLKQRLLGMVPMGAVNRVKVRIVVPELEAWYLGDPQAIVQAGFITPAVARRIMTQAKFRNLCNLIGAKNEFKRLVGPIGQLNAAREIGPKLDPQRNTSRNFHAFLEAIAWAVGRARQELARIV